MAGGSDESCVLLEKIGTMKARGTNGNWWRVFLKTNQHYKELMMHRLFRTYFSCSLYRK